MKTINTYLFTTVILALTIVSCSKKPISNSIDENNQKYSRQLEMQYDNNSTLLSASTNENALIIPTAERRFDLSESKLELASIKTNKNLKTKSLNAKGENIKVISESHPMYKMVSKRVEKLTKDQKATGENAISGRLRTGIILAAIGLVLLLLAYVMPFPINVIFYVGGAILFIIGIVLILLDIL